MKHQTVFSATPARAELKKGHHLHLFLIPLGFFIILFFWAGFANNNPSDYDLAQGYTFTLFQLPTLNCILMPTLLAVLASRLCDMEIKGQTFKLLYTLEDAGCFYDWKFLHECFYLLLFVIGEGILLPLIGTMFHFTEQFPMLLVFRHMGCTLLVGAVVLTLQHFLSLMFQNQIVSLLVGIMGSFLGLFSLYFPPQYAKLVLWGYFGAFTPFGMDYDRDLRLISFYPVDFPIVTFVLFLAFGIALYVVCRTIFLKREV